MTSLKTTFVELIRNHWQLRLLLFPVLRPRRFLQEFVYLFFDYLKFRKSAGAYRKFVFTKLKPETPPQKTLLCVSGKLMNVLWCEIWAVMAASFLKKYRLAVITTRNEPIRNLFYKFFKFNLIFLEDLNISQEPVPESLIRQLETLKEFSEFKEFRVDGNPVGSMAISTYSRLRATGIIDVSEPETRKEVLYWITYIYQSIAASKRLYQAHQVEMLFFTEIFMEEYGAFYYGALEMELNIVRFAGTVRDNAVVIQHMTRESDRTHHASVVQSTWQKILTNPDSARLDEELHQNFMDRYGDKWALSKRNQPNTKILSAEEAREFLGIPKDRKIAVIFSHILYDTLFFIGKDLFPSYAHWFVESVKAACKNPNIQWYIKVHPSNLWRGELEHFFGGKYEEVRLIEKYIGEKLPDHVKLVYPDTPLSPYTWFQIADYGITVRGTSGIELGALGKTVITAGTGRYEFIGFTLNPKTADEYLKMLESLPAIEEPTEAQRRLGVKFAYVTFCSKPFTLDFLKPVVRTGKKSIFSSDDLVYLADFGKEITALPASMERFQDWSQDRMNVDILNEWPEA